LADGLILTPQGTQCGPPFSLSACGFPYLSNLATGHGLFEFAPSSSHAGYSRVKEILYGSRAVNTDSFFSVDQHKHLNLLRPPSLFLFRTLSLYRPRRRQAVRDVPFMYFLLAANGTPVPPGGRKTNLVRISSFFSNFSPPRAGD